MIESVQLKELVKRNRENRLAHAFLLETNNYNKCYTDLLNLLKMLNCPFEYKNKCNESCNICSLIEANNLPSLVFVEPDGQAIKKDQILDVMNKFSTKPVFSKFNMYIIKNADRLNSAAGNTILKFLEEPEENILGFFITNNKENIMSTIKSRCQIINCFYDEEELLLDDVFLDEVKIYLNNIYKNSEDLFFNREHMVSLYTDRNDWEIFFTTMLFYLLDCLNDKRVDKVEVINNTNKENIIKMITKIKEILNYIKRNGNIELILDKFVIEMREYYE